MDALDLIRLVCKRPWQTPEDHTPYSDEDMAHIRHFRDKVQDAIGEFNTSHDVPTTPIVKQAILAQLYRYAALIYLTRAGQNISFSSLASSFHKKLVDAAMVLLQGFGSCETAWPLFILACEADTDERRLQILDIFTTTMADPGARSNHIPLVQHIVQAVWNQNDLDVGSEVHYTRTLNVVISTAPFLPLLS
jgi:hypothetical protein